MKTKLDIQAANELRLYIINDYDLYSMTEKINENLSRKHALGIYDHGKACKAFAFAVKLAAMKYCCELCVATVRYYDIFNAATRREVCEMMAIDYESEVRAQC